MINIRKLENELWESADLLRQGSKLTSNQYCMPVLGLIFLRYAHGRFKLVEAEILKNRPVRNGRVMPVEASDFAEKSALYLPPEARYDYLVNLPESADIGKAVNRAMELIEEQSEQLVGVLPKDYTMFTDEILSELLRIFNNSALDETMELMNIQDQNLEEGVKNAASYRFMAQVNNFTKADDLKNERLRFSQENLTKDAEAGGLLLFPNTYMNFQQIKNNIFEIDPEQTKLINDNVFKYFGVNDKILKNEATGDELDAFFNGAIEPFAIQFSEALTKAMFSERERANGSYLIANADRLQYMTTKAQVEMAQQMLDRGVMSINEARELFNYDPVPGGDVRTIRGEYKSADEVNEVGGSNDAS